jgi:SAM-dependent methyltransferase
MNQDFMNAEFEPASFDLILCIGLMVHLVSPADFIAKVATLLKPGGSIIMECSDASHFTFKLLYPIYRFKALFRPSTYSLNAVTYAEIAKILKQQGLVEEVTFRYSAPAPLLDRVLSQRTLYKLNRLVYGNVGQSRNAWLGNECLSLFSKPV